MFAFQIAKKPKFFVAGVADGDVQTFDLEILKGSWAEGESYKLEALERCAHGPALELPRGLQNAEGHRVMLTIKGNPLIL
jgi:hypothetical protein